MLDKVLAALAEDLRQRGKIDLSEAFIDGTHAGAKRGALRLESLDAAKRPRSWPWQISALFPRGRFSEASLAQKLKRKRRMTLPLQRWSETICRRCLTMLVVLKMASTCSGTRQPQKPCWL